MYEKCKEGLHPLIEIMRTSDGFTDKVVRWCPDCGAVVIDVDCDGRVYPGQIMNMRLPENVKFMEDYKLTLDALNYYKYKACEEAKKKCDKCAAGYRYNNEVWCAFAVVDHFIWNFCRYGSKETTK